MGLLGRNGLSASSTQAKIWTLAITATVWVGLPSAHANRGQQLMHNLRHDYTGQGTASGQSRTWKGYVKNIFRPGSVPLSAADSRKRQADQEEILHQQQTQHALHAAPNALAQPQASQPRAGVEHSAEELTQLAQNHFRTHDEHHTRAAELAIKLNEIDQQHLQTTSESSRARLQEQREILKKRALAHLRSAKFHKQLGISAQQQASVLQTAAQRAELARVNAELKGVMRRQAQIDQALAKPLRTSRGTEPTEAEYLKELEDLERASHQ